jgi:hypothetical protein
VALYEAPDKRRLLVWASSWDSESAARRFAKAWLDQRQALHQAAVVFNGADSIKWTQPDGHAGTMVARGKNVLVFEADKPDTVLQPAAWQITFSPPREESARAAANSALLRFNPLFSWQQDADYTVRRTFWGILWRHDRNAVGASDRLALGLLGESHRTASFNQWELGWSLLAKHEADARRGYCKTAVLPWGVLYDQFGARWPQAPNRTFTRVSAVWGLAGSWTQDGAGRSTLHILPAGILFCREKSPLRSSTTVLGTGISRTKSAPGFPAKIRFRLLGVRL